MSGTKVGLCTVNDSSEVTMINEDGVIAEMIIEVDDDNQLEAHEPFNFELDEDDDCIEVYSSGFSPSRNNNIEQNSSQNWICNRDIQFGVNIAGEQKEITPGLHDLNLLGESGIERPHIPLIGSVTSSEKADGCIAIDDANAKKPKKKYGKQLPPPKSRMVTRGKAAANQVSVDVPKEAISDKTAKEDAVNVVMETTSGKDITNSVVEDITSNITSNKCGDSGPSLVDAPKETSKKTLTNEIPKEVSKNPSDTLKETAESSHECHENNTLASKANEVNSISHKMDEDTSVAEQQFVHGCGEKLGDIPFIQQVIQNTTRRLGLQALYKLIYGFRVPKDMEVVKERVMQFSGFPFEENSIDFERKMKALRVFPDVARKQICCILGIEVNPKTDTNHGILKFLLKPKSQNNQYMGARYQPLVLLERLPEELLKYETVEGNLVQMAIPTKKESPVKKHKKRKAAVENSEVRLTRSAKRLMKHEEKAEEMEKSIPSPGSDASKEKPSKLNKDENKSHQCEVSKKSQNNEKVKVRKGDVSDVPLEPNSDTDTDDCLYENLKQAFPDSSDGVRKRNRRTKDNKQDDADLSGMEDQLKPTAELHLKDGETCSTKGTLGRRLGDFWNIRQNVEKADKESLQALHTVLYDSFNNYDKPENWKKNILRFSGFNFKCVSSKWKRKEFILSLMPPSKLKRIADMLHLQYYSPKSQKPLVLNIMKFLSEPRDGMLKHSCFLQKRRKRRKFSAVKQQDNQDALDEEDTALEVKALLQDIRKKRRTELLEDSSAESDALDQNYCRKSKKKLGNIPNVQFMIITSNYEDIDNLHQLLFLQAGPRAKIRRNVQNFEGFTFGPGSFSYKIRIKLLNKMGYEVAKRIAFFLGLASLGTTIPQQDLNELIMHFLICPSDIKCKSIKSYPKNFFNNNPTERPVVDITSITDAVKSTIKVEKKLSKEREHNKEKPQEMKRKRETSRIEVGIISRDGTKKILKVEKDSPQNDSSESLVEETVMDCDASIDISCEKSRIKNVDDDQEEEMWMQEQKNSEIALSPPRPVRKRKSGRKKLNVPCIGKRKRTIFKKENNQPGKNTVKLEVDDMPKKQFLFRFDTDNKFDSQKILEYLNRESQKSVTKEIEVPKTEVAEPAQTTVQNVPVKINVKPELPGSPKVISILLPPPSQSPQKNVSVSSDLNKTNSGASTIDSATSLKNVSTSSSNASFSPEGKLPIPPLPKKQVINLTPQSLQNLQPRVPSTNVTQIKVPSSLLEGMKSSQIRSIIRLPQNFATGQNSGQVSSSVTRTGDVLSLPEVQKCLQQISSANGKKKQVQMIKIPASSSAAIQGSLNMSGGKVYVIPVKPGSQQFSSIPVSSVVTPIHLNNHIVIPSSSESGTPVNIPQIIQVAKNYSRTAGTTALPVSSVTIAKVKPELVSPVSFPTVPTSQCLFPISVTSNSNLFSLPVVKIQNTLVKDPNPAPEPPFVVQTDKVNAVKQNQNLIQQGEDNNSDSELDEEPLSHLVGHPSDDMLIQNIREIVIGADLSSITMRNVFQKVFDKYPQFDLTYRKCFLKDAVKKVICSAPPSKIA